KGSFYYYFGSKEDFGLQVIEFYEQTNRERVNQFLSDTTRPPLERLKAYFEANIIYLGRFNFSCGCLLGDLGQEMSGQNENFRVRVNQALVSWTEDVEVCLREAQAAGQLAPDADVRLLAEFCLNSWQGAILRMKAEKSPQPLETFIQVVFNTVLRG
ncbi:MAG TPA: TetR family transcriptional regulator C-terminal domain-containing protein, partial [Phototrophicaceae bacterium]|nr:TetR family transcriptional regulator C-terminal domain-containing protein [Phototrophicaceae bacterium]